MASTVSSRNIKTPSTFFEGIIITHFINPHMFWFRPELSFLKNDDFYLLEEKMVEYYTQNSKGLFESEYIPKKNEVVAVYMVNWVKWIRAVVERVVDMADNQKRIILWAIDMGFPLEADTKWIKKLPKEIAFKQLSHSYFGGLIDVVPSETTFDFTINEAISEIAEKWSERAVKEFEKIIQKSAQIKFLPEKIINNQTFGRLEVTTYEGTTIDANDVLVKLNVGMRSNDFFDDLDKIKTNKIDRYKTNSGTLAFSSLNYNKFTSFNDCNSSEYSAPKEISQKIIDWGVRNNQAKYEFDMPDDTSNCQDQESDVFDSVSVFHHNTYKPVMPTFDESEQAVENTRGQRSQYATTNSFNITEDTNQDNTIDDDEDIENNYIKKCGTNRVKLNEKFKNSPPRPPKIPFDAPLNTRPVNTGPIMSSQYHQKLMAMKNKVIAKVKPSLDSSLEDKSSTASSNVSNSSSSKSLNSTIPQSILSKYARTKSEVLKQMRNTKISDTANKELPSFKSDKHIPTANSQFETTYDDYEDELSNFEFQQEQQKRADAERSAINFIPAGFDQGRITEEIIDRNVAKTMKKHMKTMKSDSDEMPEKSRKNQTNRNHNMHSNYRPDSDSSF